MLQRGRARAGAEIKRGAIFLCPDWPLQRGRARAGAEIYGIVGAEGQQENASTGPRPRGRGNEQ